MVPIDLVTMQSHLAQQTKQFDENLEKQNEKLMQQMKQHVAAEVSNQMKPYANKLETMSTDQTNLRAEVARITEKIEASTTYLCYCDSKTSCTRCSKSRNFHPCLDARCHPRCSMYSSILPNHY